MKLVFAGTPEFAAIALAALIDAGHDLSLVLTQPDRPAGRGMQPQPSTVKTLALRHGIEVLQPLALKTDAAAQERIRAQQADALIVAAYGLILPQCVLDMPRFGAINIHASLLPRWRGAAPIQRAILADDAQSGVVLMQMDAGLDTGALLTSATTPLYTRDTATSLHDRIAALGARLLVETLPRLPLPAVPQATEGITYAAKIDKAEARLDWRKSAAELDRQIRAFTPFPIACAHFNGDLLKIHAAHPVPLPTAAVPGTAPSVSREGICVACGEGALMLTELQKAGGKRLAAAQFLAGYPALKTGVRFE
ncbi:MAG: methionyl-tRNA formyltransferase [Zoogloeaceae bacterium]|jgi:methionyl-tRNA formyltransferase|nr:methionyl-tRNA formyltransferase [Zoogloeaceae bacterium]